MFRREEVEKILNQAESIDSKHDLFGASAHQYKLNPPVSRTFVHDVEERYHFLLPEDYVHRTISKRCGKVEKNTKKIKLHLIFKRYKSKRYQNVRSIFKNRIIIGKSSHGKAESLSCGCFRSGGSRRICL
ncbi:MAG: hypothetical protein K2P59_07185 [Acetatifactor sp.]|nr:hypothetical protein [Acetatifactor sp.]